MFKLGDSVIYDNVRCTIVGIDGIHGFIIAGKIRTFSTLDGLVYEYIIANYPYAALVGNFLQFLGSGVGIVSERDIKPLLTYYPNSYIYQRLYPEGELINGMWVVNK